MTEPFPDLLDRYAKAVWDKDVTAFLDIFAPDVRQFDMWADWAHEGREGMRPGVESWLGGLGDERVRVTFEVIRSQADGALAYAEAWVRFAAIAPDGGELRAMDNRFTFVALRRDGGWRVLHAHSSAPLSDSAQAMFERPR